MKGRNRDGETDDMCPKSHRIGNEGQRATTKSHRGQAYTLEALVAGLLLLSAILFALQVTAVTPLSASTSSQHIENQQRSTAAGALTAAEQAEALKPSVSTITADGNFYGPGAGGTYVNDFPNDEFGDIMNRTFSGRGIAITVDVRYQDGPGSWDRTRMVDRGSPSDHAVTATRSLTLYDDDPIYDDDGMKTGTWGEDDPFSIAEDVNQDSDVYSVVIVEVTVWRM